MYRYFISYAVSIDDSITLGDAVMNLDSPIEDKEDIEIIRAMITRGLKDKHNFMAKNFMAKDISIRNYILMNRHWVDEAIDGVHGKMAEAMERVLDG